MRKRFYILFVARGDDGQLRKISIPLHYLYVFVVGAAIGFLGIILSVPVAATIQELVRDLETGRLYKHEEEAAKT